MCGSETLTMVVSSNSMKAARVTTIAISHGLAAGRPLSRPLPPSSDPSFPPSVTKMHHRIHGQAQRQRASRIESAIDHDLDGDALHDLNEVARRILSGEGGEARAAAVLDALHVAGQAVARVGIDLDVDGVP